MKAFITALILLGLLLGGIAANTVTAVRYCDELRSYCDKMPPEPGEDAAAIAGELHELWNRRLWFFRMSIDSETLDAVEESLVQLSVAAACDDVFAFQSSVRGFENGIDAVRRCELPW